MDASDAVKSYFDAVAIKRAADFLRGEGFVVIPRERHVVATARYIVPPFDMESRRFSEPRYDDMVRATNLRKLIHHADDNGLVLHLKQDINDPVTGREVVFTSAMGLIVPKAEDEV